MIFISLPDSSVSFVTLLYPTEHNLGILILGEGGDNRTVDTGVPKHSQRRIKIEILSLGEGGDDRTVDFGISKYMTYTIQRINSVLTPSTMRME